MEILLEENHQLLIKFAKIIDKRDQVLIATDNHISQMINRLVNRTGDESPQQENSAVLRELLRSRNERSNTQITAYFKSRLEELEKVLSVDNSEVSESDNEQDSDDGSGEDTESEDHPPGDSPPGDSPPGDSPPGDSPPGDSPPGNSPPGNSPPGDSPPGNSPPRDNSNSDDSLPDFYPPEDSPPPVYAPRGGRSANGISGGSFNGQWSNDADVLSSGSVMSSPDLSGVMAKVNVFGSLDDDGERSSPMQLDPQQSLDRDNNRIIEINQFSQNAKPIEKIRRSAKKLGGVSKAKWRGKKMSSGVKCQASCIKRMPFIKEWGLLNQVKRTKQQPQVASSATIIGLELRSSATNGRSFAYDWEPPVELMSGEPGPSTSQELGLCLRNVIPLQGDSTENN